MEPITTAGTVIELGPYRAMLSKPRKGRNQPRTDAIRFLVLGRLPARPRSIRPTLASGDIWSDGHVQIDHGVLSADVQAQLRARVAFMHGIGFVRR